MHRPFQLCMRSIKSVEVVLCSIQMILTPFTSLLTDLYNLASSSDYIRDMRINEKLGTLLYAP